MDNGASSYRRFLDGDDTGFVEIVRDYKDGLILYLDSFVRNVTAAEELAEDTFVRLGVKKPHFAGKSSFRTWLYAIGRNVALDALRKQARRGAASLDDCAEPADAAESLESAYLREERKIIVHKAMNRLKSEYRQVLWLIYFEGFSCKEAAEIMKKSTHSIETLTYRARQALKSELMGEGFQHYEDL